MKNLLFVNGSIVLDANKTIEMVEDDAELAQCVDECLAVNRGEWFLNAGHGFPRFDVLGQKHSRERTTDLLISSIMQEPRIASVEAVNFEMDTANRKLKITYTARKADGGTITGGVGG